jgi:hypothetical protein
MITISSTTHEYFENSVETGVIVDSVSNQNGFTLIEIFQNNDNSIFIDAGMDKLLLVKLNR